jgi:anti-anti-sigma factor
MTHIASQLAAHFTPRRRAIYTKILTAPDADWTVASLASSLALSRDSVRSTLYVLLTDGLMTQVPAHRALTFRLTPEGTQALASVLDTWRHTHADSPRVPSDHKRAVQSDLPTSADCQPRQLPASQEEWRHRDQVTPDAPTQINVQVTRPIDNDVHAMVFGELDTWVADEFLDLVLKDLSDGSNLILDLAGLTFCDASGIQRLVRLHQHQIDAGGALQVINLTKQVRRVIETTGLADLLGIDRPLAGISNQSRRSAARP